MLRAIKSDVFSQIDSDELLPRVNPLVAFGGLLIVGTITTAINLASIIKYNVTVKAPATVRPTGDIRLIQAAQAGEIREIFVKTNQTVKAGEVIATIDDTQLQTKKRQLQDNIAHLQRQQENLKIQAQQLESQISYERLSFQQALAVARYDYELVSRNYQNQKIITIASVEQAQAELIYAQEALQRYQQLAHTGAIATLLIDEQQLAVRDAKAKLNKALAEQNPTNASLEIARRKIAQEEEKGKITILALQKQQKEIIDSKFELQKQINNHQQEIQQIEVEIDKTEIRSPVSGTILELKLRNRGQVVDIGRELAQIAPSQAPLIVKARVEAKDIGKISVCQAKNNHDCSEGQVQMRISAYPYPDYGILTGTVKAVSPDTLLSPVGSSNEVVNPYYEVTIEPDRLNLEKNGQLYPLKLGMEVTADIVSREETVLNSLLIKTKLIADDTYL
jgi:HlyD family type I secretion membrane fusion protein